MTQLHSNSPIEDQSGAALLGQALEQTTRAIHEKRGPHRTHQGQWAVLRFLASAPLERRTVGGVAIQLGATHAPASRSIAALTRKGLVEVKPVDHDRRLRRIDLTASGRALLSRDPTHRLTRAIEVLSPDERQKFAAALHVIRANLGDAPTAFAAESGAGHGVNVAG